MTGDNSESELTENGENVEYEELEKHEEVEKHEEKTENDDEDDISNFQVLKPVSSNKNGNQNSEKQINNSMNEWVVKDSKRPQIQNHDFFQSANSKSTLQSIQEISNGFSGSETSEIRFRPNFSNSDFSFQNKHFYNSNSNSDLNVPDQNLFNPNSDLNFQVPQSPRVKKYMSIFPSNQNFRKPFRKAENIEHNHLDHLQMPKRGNRNQKISSKLSIHNFEQNMDSDFLSNFQNQYQNTEGLFDQNKPNQISKPNSEQIQKELSQQQTQFDFSQQELQEVPLESSPQTGLTNNNSLGFATNGRRNDFDYNEEEGPNDRFPHQDEMKNYKLRKAQEEDIADDFVPPGRINNKRKSFSKNFFPLNFGGNFHENQFQSPERNVDVGQRPNQRQVSRPEVTFASEPFLESQTRPKMNENDLTDLKMTRENFLMDNLNSFENNFRNERKKQFYLNRNNRDALNVQHDQKSHQDVEEIQEEDLQNENPESKYYLDIFSKDKKRNKLNNGNHLNVKPNVHQVENGSPDLKQKNPLYLPVKPIQVLNPHNSDVLQQKIPFNEQTQNKNENIATFNWNDFGNSNQQRIAANDDEHDDMFERRNDLQDYQVRSTNDYFNLESAQNERSSLGTTRNENKVEDENRRFPTTTVSPYFHLNLDQFPPKLLSVREETKEFENLETGSLLLPTPLPSKSETRILSPDTTNNKVSIPRQIYQPPKKAKTVKVPRPALHYRVI